MSAALRIGILLSLLTGTGVAVAAPPDCERMSGALSTGIHLIEVHEQAVASRGQIIALRLDSAGDWAARPADLQKLRVMLAPALAGADWVPLRQVPGLQWQLDSCRLVMALNLQAVSRPGQTVAVRRSRANRALHAAEPTLGLQLSPRSEFDRRWRHTGNVRLLASGRWGYGQSEWLHDGTALRRLDTYWVKEFPGQRERLRVGDAISQAASWGRPLRFAGLQWGTDHSLDPYFVSYPLPSIEGRAGLPSIADLYINGVRQQPASVEGGAFRITEVPAVSGAGELQVVLRDLAGRAVTLSQPYYLAPELLRPSLRSVNAELGVLRNQYGLESDGYGKAYAALGLRQGATNTLTWSLRMEAVPRHPVVGASVDWLWPELGLWSFSGALSHEQQTGWQTQLGFSRQAQQWNFGAVVQRRSADYRALGEEAQALRDEYRLRAARGQVFGGTLFASYLEQQRAEGGQRVQVLGWGRALPRWQAQFNLQLQQIRGERRDDRALLNLSWPFGGGLLFAANTQISNDGGNLYQASVVRPRRGALGAGWRVTAEQGLIERLRGDLSWTASRAEVRAYSSTGLGGAWAFEADTQWTLSRAGVHWGRVGHGAQALVQTGMPGIRVFLDNRLVGRTDADGQLLVAGLRAYEVNRLHVSDEDLPINRHIQHTNATVVPPRGALVTVKLATGAMRSGLVRLLLSDGSFVPAHAEVQIEAQGAALLSDLNQRFYVSDYRPGEQLVARWDGQHCRADLPVWSAIQVLPCTRPQP